MADRARAPSSRGSVAPSEHTIAELPDVVPRDAPESNASSAGSGNSSPQHESSPPPPRLMGKAADLDFAVEDVDMWDMLLALDSARTTRALCPRVPAVRLHQAGIRICIGNRIALPTPTLPLVSRVFRRRPS